MPLTPEKLVKNKVTQLLRLKNIYYFYPFSHGYGSIGIPDLIACYKGRFIAIECKAGKGKVTTLQEKNLTDIRACGGVALVINENNIDDISTQLNIIDSAE
jgi:hypothetical protein